MYEFSAIGCEVISPINTSLIADVVPFCIAITFATSSTVQVLFVSHTRARCAVFVFASGTNPPRRTIATRGILRGHTAQDKRWVCFTSPFVW